MADVTLASTSSALSGATLLKSSGSPATGTLAKFSAANSLTSGDLSGDVTTSGSLVVTIANGAITTAKLANSVVTLAKIQNASANSKLIGSGASGSGSPYTEITLGTNLSMSGTTLNASGGGGGTTTYYTTYASPPASPVSGDLWFVQNTPYLARYNGSSWDYFCEGVKVYPPATYTWTNLQGSKGTLSTTNGLLTLSATVGAGSDDYQLYGHAAPATPYTIDMAFYGLFLHRNYFNSGIFWRDSGTAKISTCGPIDGGVNDTMGFQINQATTNTYDSTALNERCEFNAAGNSLIWMRITDDGVNRTFSVSFDQGITYTQLYTTARTTWQTPNQVGFFVNAYNATIPNKATLISWREY